MYNIPVLTIGANVFTLLEKVQLEKFAFVLDCTTAPSENREKMQLWNMHSPTHVTLQLCWQSVKLLFCTLAVAPVSTSKGMEVL